MIENGAAGEKWADEAIHSLFCYTDVLVERRRSHILAGVAGKGFIATVAAPVAFRIGV